MRKTILIIFMIAMFALVLFVVSNKTYDWFEREAENVEQNKSNDTNDHMVDVFPDNHEENSETSNFEGQTYFISEDDFATFKEKGLNPFGEDVNRENLTDETIQDYIHGMSHQKVRAEKKWGFYEVHPVRIEWLLDGLDQVVVKHESVYRQILEKWSKDDFKTADQDHNKIWNLQNGTVGKATGLLSKEEEQEYLKKQYKKR